MRRLIDADALYKKVTEEYCDIVAGCYPFNIVAYDMAKMVKNAPTVDAVPVTEIYRVIAGHSVYQGDSILAALTCIAEGKNVKPIKPVK